MKIDHPLWQGSMLQLMCEHKDELDQMSAVRAEVAAKRCLPDLTEGEHSYLQALEQWLDERNREYE